MSPLVRRVGVQEGTLGKNGRIQPGRTYAPPRRASIFLGTAILSLGFFTPLVAVSTHDAGPPREKSGQQEPPPRAAPPYSTLENTDESSRFLKEEIRRLLPRAGNSPKPADFFRAPETSDAQETSDIGGSRDSRLPPMSDVSWARNAERSSSLLQQKEQVRFSFCGGGLGRKSGRS